jgi:hypothetical protein
MKVQINESSRSKGILLKAVKKKVYLTDSYIYTHTVHIKDQDKEANSGADSHTVVSVRNPPSCYLLLSPL